jgi:hypothetical protein
VSGSSGGIAVGPAAHFEVVASFSANAAQGRSLNHHGLVVRWEPIQPRADPALSDLTASSPSTPRPRRIERSAREVHARLRSNDLRRPVVLTNAAVYFIAATVMLKVVVRGDGRAVLWAITILVTVFAAIYIWLLFRGPVERDFQSQSR